MLSCLALRLTRFCLSTLLPPRQDWAVLSHNVLEKETKGEGFHLLNSTDWNMRCCPQLSRNPHHCPLTWAPQCVGFMTLPFMTQYRVRVPSHRVPRVGTQGPSHSSPKLSLFDQFPGTPPVPWVEQAGFITVCGQRQGEVGMGGDRGSHFPPEVSG